MLILIICVLLLILNCVVCVISLGLVFVICIEWMLFLFLWFIWVSDLVVFYIFGLLDSIFEIMRFVFMCLYSWWNGLFVMFVIGVNIKLFFNV